VYLNELLFVLATHLLIVMIVLLVLTIFVLVFVMMRSFVRMVFVRNVMMLILVRAIKFVLAANVFVQAELLRLIRESAGLVTPMTYRTVIFAQEKV
jgi:hypothetical protein